MPIAISKEFYDRLEAVEKEIKSLKMIIENLIVSKDYEKFKRKINHQMACAHFFREEGQDQHLTCAYCGLRRI